MHNADWPKVQAEARRQGWIVTPTSTGFSLKAPDGVTQVVMHRLHRSSDPNALSRTVQRMRRSGFQWPPPNAGRR